MPANRKNPGVHHTARQSRDREGALADYVAGMRSLTVAALSGASRPSASMSHTRVAGNPLRPSARQGGFDGGNGTAHRKGFGPDMDHLLRMQLAYDVAKTRRQARSIAVKRYTPPAA